MDKVKFLIVCGLVCTGCAAGAPAKRGSGQPAETPAQQMAAAQKVMGAMAGKEVSREDLKRVAADIQTNEDSRNAVNKIIGVQSPMVIKYSPVTGKHYSGDLEFDPETGARLEILQE